MMRTWRGAVVQLASLMAFWLVLTDQYGTLFTALGLASAVGITALTRRVLVAVLDDEWARDADPATWGGPPPIGLVEALRRTVWFAAYLAWLLTRIVVASVQLAWFVVRPQVRFDPAVVRFRTQMRGPIARTALATSITLVPGTLTVRSEGGELIVHTLFPASADDLASARMQNLVARFCGEDAEPPPAMHWEPAIPPAPTSEATR